MFCKFHLNKQKLLLMFHKDKWYTVTASIKWAVFLFPLGLYKQESCRLGKAVLEGYLVNHRPLWMVCADERSPGI